MNSTTEIWLLRIRSLIADKEMEVAKANLELARGGEWLSDHQGAINGINQEIEGLISEIHKYS